MGFNCANNIYIHLNLAKSLSDLVNESLTLSEEATIAASAEVSRLSSPPPPQQLSLSTSSPPPSSTGATGTTTGELVQGTNTGDIQSSSNQQHQRQLRQFNSGGMLFGASRKILPGPPPERLVAITNNMNSHLTSLLVSGL